jgi:hypothetical protein
MLSRAAIASAVAAVAAVSTAARPAPGPSPSSSGGSAGACRDRYAQPFSPDSIWNTPLGAGANFQPAYI